MKKNVQCPDNPITLTKDLTNAGGQSDKKRVVGTQAIDRALSILGLFTKEKKAEFHLNAIAEALELNISTTRRLLRVLVVNGFLSQNEETGGYCLGKMVIVLGELARHSFGLDQAIPILIKLAENYKESVSLGIQEGDSVVVVQCVESNRELRFTQRIGTRVPLHASALGKVVLCAEENIENYINTININKQFTNNTITDANNLLEEIQRSKERGYTIDYEEQYLGVRCVGVPIFDNHGKIRAALSIQGPSARLPDSRLHEIGRDLQPIAKRLSAAMSGPLL